MLQETEQQTEGKASVESLLTLKPSRPGSPGYPASPGKPCSGTRRAPLVSYSQGNSLLLKIKENYLLDSLSLLFHHLFQVFPVKTETSVFHESNSKHPPHPGREPLCGLTIPQEQERQSTQNNYENRTAEEDFPTFKQWSLMSYKSNKRSIWLHHEQQRSFPNGNGLADDMQRIHFNGGFPNHCRVGAGNQWVGLLSPDFTGWEPSEHLSSWPLRKQQRRAPRALCKGCRLSMRSQQAGALFRQTPAPASPGGLSDRGGLLIPALKGFRKALQEGQGKTDEPYQPLPLMFL